MARHFSVTTETRPKKLDEGTGREWRQCTEVAAQLSPTRPPSTRAGQLRHVACSKLLPLPSSLPRHPPPPRHRGERKASRGARGKRPPQLCGFCFRYVLLLTLFLPSSYPLLILFLSSYSLAFLSPRSDKAKLQCERDMPHRAIVRARRKKERKKERKVKAFISSSLCSLCRIMADNGR